MHKPAPHPYRKQPKYPGLRPEDKRIWEAFVDAVPDQFDVVFYNVHVGDPCECGPEIGDQARRAWDSLTRWKIDVLAADDNLWWVIEVKPNANAKAVGQALSYKALLPDVMDISGTIVPAVLTDSASPSTRKACRRLGVKLIETDMLT